MKIENGVELSNKEVLLDDICEKVALKCLIGLCEPHLIDQFRPKLELKRIGPLNWT